jgi:hypothetical protein
LQLDAEARIASARRQPGHLSFSGWSGLLLPKGTPIEIIGTLNAAVVGTLPHPALQSRLIEFGSYIFPRTTDARGALFMAWDHKVETAFMAPETVFHFRAGSSGERRSHLAINPTTRALKTSADLRLEARKALLQDGRGMEVRLYLSFARRYFCKLVFQIEGALLGMSSNLGGKLSYFRHVGHYMSPTTGQTSRSAWTILEIGILLGSVG